MKRLDNYQLEIVLGKGYSGQVYLAKNMQSNQKCAIKILNKRIPNYIKLVKDTQKEAIILQQINHPNVV
jgi:serine/threonine protein kinase